MQINTSSHSLAKTVFNSFNIHRSEDRTKPANELELSEEDKKRIEELKKRDREVRAHEHAHLAAGGQYVKGGPTYEYTTGPDGKRYAIGGEVQLDSSEIPNDPHATIQKMQQIRRAALAPLKPSAQDRRVAAQASIKENEARQKLSLYYKKDANFIGKNINFLI